MENKKEKLFRHGDKVYHHKYGHGEVHAATDKIVGVAFEGEFKELHDDEINLLSFTPYKVIYDGFSLDQPERNFTWRSIWEDFCDEHSYEGISYFLKYLKENYKLPDKLNP
jgi:hypothetical protein